MLGNTGNDLKQISYKLLDFTLLFHPPSFDMVALVLLMRKVSVGSVNKILLILAQSLYVIYYKRNTLLQAHMTC